MTNDQIVTECLLCNTNEHTKVKFKQNFSPGDLNADIFSARRTTEHYHYQMLECQKCSSVFSSPILPYEKIESLYKSSKQNYDNEVSYIAETYINYVKKYGSVFDHRDKALEIGCGSGFFLRELQKVGFKEVFGVEPSESAVAKAGELKSNIFTGFFEKANYPANSFDLIACFQTLDHLINPLEVLKKSYELLKPGGIAYFIVHNEKGLQARLFGEQSPIYDVEHIYLFNKKTLPLITQKAGFNVVKVFNVKNSYPLGYWLRMAPIPLKKQITAVVGSLRLLNIKIGIYPGNIGIFVQKPGKN
ncbi:MAG: class I SAM-dependent methyltransferase [Bacteroidia bacterium]|nr:class I SAM-dependent methyltransferase [Bacteroidia bacterium]